MKTEFFRGERVLDRFEVSLDDDVHVACEVSERWRQQVCAVLTCGAELTRAIKRRRGAGRRDKDELESVIAGSLGISGVAAFASRIRSEAGKEIRLEEHLREYDEQEDRFRFQAPRCGRYNVQIYQLQHVYRFDIDDRRFLGRGRVAKTVCVWTDRIHDDSKQILNDPGCGYDARPEAGGDGQLMLSAGPISMLVTHTATTTGVQLSELDSEFTGTLEQLVGTEHEIPRNLFPPHLLFLADPPRGGLKATFRRHVEPPFGLPVAERPSGQGPSLARRAATGERQWGRVEKPLPSMSSGDAGLGNDLMAEVLIRRAAALETLGEGRQAIEDYSRIIDRTGMKAADRARAIFHRGVLRNEQGDLQGAIDDYTKFMQMNVSLGDAPGDVAPAESGDTADRIDEADAAASPAERLASADEEAHPKHRDRRETPRADVDAGTRLIVYDENGRPVDRGHARLDNLSMDGMRLSDVDLDFGSPDDFEPHEVVVRVDDGTLRGLELRAAMIRKQPRGDRQIHFGFSFVGVSPVAEHRIQSHIASSTHPERF